MARTSAYLYQIKVILHHIKPTIWRRIIAPGYLTLWELHAILQVVMGWQESHLHSFLIKDNEYGDPEDDEFGTRELLDEFAFRIDRVIPRQVGFRFTYLYDYGDNWEHVLLVEKISPAEKGNKYPPVCLDGQRAGPPEDVGGPPGYEMLLKALSDPQDPQHEALSTWAGKEFDPEAFDNEHINSLLLTLDQLQYQLEALYALEYNGDDDDFLFSEEDGEADEEDEDSEEIEKMSRIFGNWVTSLPADLLQACEDLPLRKDYLSLLTYLNEHTVKGTNATGNFPLKAVREINAGFVHPQPLDTPEHKLRSEEDVYDLMFLHTLAFSRDLIDGGPGERWALTEDGEYFITLPPAAHVMDMFVGWLVSLSWGTDRFDLDGEEQTLSRRQKLVKLLAQQPQDTWLPVRTLIEHILSVTGWGYVANIEFISRLDLPKNIILPTIFSPLLQFGAIDWRAPEGALTDPDWPLNADLRFTPLGSSLLKVVTEMIE